ncbi:unnamed protein product [Adineta steineri]|uniref:DUF4781 domain-containing protein n=1 Tax=Adineta steineri TaxID=433720 RepID=A0A818P5H3_9BILA|nr:unnamed protein product [Adineta steineri]
MSTGTDSRIPEPPKNQPSYHNTDSNWTDVDDWIARATEAQNQEYAKNAGRTENIAETIDQIETYILTTAFGTNGVKQCCLTVSLKFWYSHVYRSIAAKIRKRMQKHARSTTVKLNAIFVMALLKDKVKDEKTNKMKNAETTVPVFYFKNSDGKFKYIDLFARVYNDWAAYLTENWIDPALMCYPKDGHYGQEQKTDKPTFNPDVLPDLDIEESPACGVLRTVGRWTQKALAVVTPILTVASVVGIIPGLKNMKCISKLSPMIQHTNKYYRYVNLASTITFSLVSIGDKMTHGGDWTDVIAEITVIVASVLNSLGDDLTKRYLKGQLAAGQQELTAAQTFWFNLFAWSRCASAVAGVLTTLVAMMYKPECSAMDYFLLASSLYSCYGALTSPKSAQAIFNQVAEQNKAAKTKTENNQSAEKDKDNTDSDTNKDQHADTDRKNDNADAGNNVDNGGQKEPPNEELIKKRDELAKTMIKDENDEAGKAAYKYYEDNFVLAFKDTENEYVMNKQLVRMMQYAPDIREMFCEIALTETTLDIKDGILLVNGQLNIDGAALAQVHNPVKNADVAERLKKKIEGADPTTYQNGNQTDREILFHKTKDFNVLYTNLTTDPQRQAEDEKFINSIQHFATKKTGYRFFFEADGRNFERQFRDDIGVTLDNYEINGKKLLEGMSTADKQRLHQQLNKLGVAVLNPTTGKQEIKYNPTLFNAAVKLANEKGCTSVRDLASYIGIMEHESRNSNVNKNVFLNDIINGTNNRLETIQQNVDALIPLVEKNMEGNKNHRGFYNSLEAYEHSMQHVKHAIMSNGAARWPLAEVYLNAPLPSVTNPRWNQWGTKEGNIKR